MAATAIKAISYICALAVGTTSTAAAGSYGIVSFFKKKNDTSTSVLGLPKTLQVSGDGKGSGSSPENHRDNDELSHSSSHSQRTIRSADQTNNTESTTLSSDLQDGHQESSGTSAQTDNLSVQARNDSSSVSSPTSNEGKSDRDASGAEVLRSSQQSKEYLEEDPSDDWEWKTYLSSGNYAEGEEEAENQDLVVAEYITKSGDKPLCKKSFRNEGINWSDAVQKECEQLTSISLWNSRNSSGENLFSLLFVDKEKIRKALEVFGLLTESLSSTKSKKWNTNNSLECRKEKGSETKFLITCIQKSS
ncbi:hypothetical protein MSUIS_01190 [Mycoplasma suis KI3806]|uniref:Uncharacterized protein n=1 Tax=Mycoplasma suis (strain KI_3806) TaxID=708248 RepID=F0V2Z0_MYCS3|nr:hypothetical protein [Mycoplasma suis]CBZ40212.1 hypothetical protein MSUIS_01190 [Mycoplasma suis KI3806]